MKKCKRCGTEISVWYYRAHIIEHDSDMDIDMDVLDGPFCLHCVVDMPTVDISGLIDVKNPQSLVSKEGDKKYVDQAEASDERRKEFRFTHKRREK